MVVIKGAARYRQSLEEKVISMLAAGVTGVIQFGFALFISRFMEYFMIEQSGVVRDPSAPDYDENKLLLSILIRIGTLGMAAFLVVGLTQYFAEKGWMPLQGIQGFDYRSLPEAEANTITLAFSLTALFPSLKEDISTYFERDWSFIPGPDFAPAKKQFANIAR